MDLNVYLSFIIISFLASLTAYFQPGTERYLRLFPIFLLLTILISVSTFYMHDQERLMRALYNFFASFEFLFYTYILREIIQNRKMKKIIFYSSLLYLLIIILNAIFVQRKGAYNSISYALGCLLIVSFCIYYFYELFQLSHSVNLMRQPAFWLCSGLLFFYCCSFPIYGLVNFLKSWPAIIQKNFNVIILLLNVFLYSSFTIAFLCRLRTRKSTS